MNRKTALAAALLIGVLAMASTARAQSTLSFSQVSCNAAGVAGVQPWGINDNGQISGGVLLQNPAITQAFVLTNGNCATFSCFDHGYQAVSTTAYGINNNGQVVGHFALSTYGEAHSFLYDGSGCTPIDPPGINGVITAINDSGQMAGYTYLNNTYKGFVITGGVYAYFDAPAGASSLEVYGINNSGVVVGSYWDSKDVVHGFTISPPYTTAPTKFDYKSAGTKGGQGTMGGAINNNGQIAGDYATSQGVAKLFVRSANGKNYSTYSYPANFKPSGANSIGILRPAGINNSGDIVLSNGWTTTPESVTLSGTVTAEQCGPNPCATAPLPGVLIDVTSTAASYQATTASDGTYSVAVAPKNTYTLTPSYTQEIGFAPPSRVVTPTASVAKLDFIACVTQLPTEANLEADFLDSLVRKPMVAANTCDPDALDWAMPNLLIPGETFGLGIGGNVNYNDYGVLNSDPYVYPSAGWDVNLFLTAGGVPGGAVSCYDPYTQWRWNVTGPSKVLKQPAPGCETSMTVQQLGTYNVTARKYTRTSSTAKWTLTKVKIGPTKVMARNFIIAGLGDSNASGEGNPPFFFSKCNRSETSYQFKAAYAVQLANQHASVTLLWPACSGARIEHVYDKPYPGTNPEPGGANPLPPQITQVTDAVRLEGKPGEPKTPRPVDAVILSIGVNNLYFGPLMRYGLAYRENFEELPTLLVPNTSADASPGSMKYELDLTMMAPPLTQLIPPLQDRLDDLYPPLANAISSPLGSGGLGVPKENVIITQYPDFTHDEKGNICDTSLLGGAVPVTFPQWNTTDWSWLGAQANELNSHVANTAITCGWTVAKVDNTSVVGFLLHGYCAGPYSLVPPLLPGFGSEPIPYWGDSWFLGVLAGYRNDNPPGPFHPVDLGHVCTAKAVDPLLCNALYGNSTCTGTPLPPK